MLGSDPNLLVGTETADDAAVYRLTDELAMIATVDFITPPVDDPWWFGQIAAANALSDVYAMGGRPITALNLVMFPSKQLDIGVLKEILRGGAEKVAEAGASLVGGHSVDDEEPKYGLCVNGVVHPDAILTNAGARAGDALVLTKPIGSGVLFNAVRAKKMTFAEIARETLPTVATLNRAALEAGRGFSLHAATDVTGFGLLGHGLEMARGASLRLRLRWDALTFYDGALAMYRKGEATGSNADNRALMAGMLELRRALDKNQQELLFDPQTSGGLLFALPAEEAPALVTALRAAGVEHAASIGEMVEGEVGVEVV